MDKLEPIFAAATDFCDSQTPPPAIPLVATLKAPYFCYPAFTKALTKLWDRCMSREQVMLVCGKSQVGKSTLIDAFIEKGQDACQISRLYCQPNWDLQQLQKKVAQGFGLTGAGCADLAADIVAMTDAAASRHFVLCLEEADSLSNEALIAVLNLANLELGLAQRLHIILLGEPEFAERLLLPPLVHHLQKGLTTIALEPLSLAETKAYLVYRFEQLGRSTHILQPQLIRKLYRRSKGLMGNLEEAITALLEQEAEQGLLPIALFKKLFSPWVMAFVGILALALLGLAWLTDLQPTFEEGVPVTTLNLLPTIPNAVTTPDRAADGVERTAMMPDLVAPAMPPAITLPLPTQPQQVVVAPPALVISVPPVVAKPVAKVKTVVEPLPKPAVKLNGAEAAVFALAAEHYTIQLLGVFNETELKQFMRSLTLSPVYRLQTSHQAKPWFIALYGDFTTRAQAVAALNKLPAALQAKRPWLRQIADVKKSVKEANAASH